MKKWLGILFFVLLPAVTWAGDRALEEEKKGDRALVKGKYYQAFDHYQTAFEKVLSQGENSPSRELQLRQARALVYLHRLYNLRGETARYSQLARLCEKALAQKVLTPFFKARLQWILLDLKITTGKLQEASQLSKKLGFLQNWALAGAFDNERGGGYATTYPPEKKIDLAAIYQGKKRKITWRFTPHSSLYGLVDLNSMFSPNNQVLAYALTYVYSPKKQPAAFRIATEESYKLWLNDHLVAKRDVKREVTFDQDHYGATLQAGWNKILVKATDQKGHWGFRLRLTTPDGGLLPKIRTVSSLEECTNLKYERGFEKNSLPPSALEGLEKRAKKAKSGRLYHYLASLYRDIRPGDENAHQARKAWKKAISFEPKNSLYYLYLSQVATRRADFSIGKEENARRFALEKALEVDSDCALAHYELAQYYLRSLHNQKKARQAIQKALAINSNFFKAQAFQAFLYRSRNWKTEAAIQLNKTLLHPQMKDLPGSLALRASQLASKSREKEAIELWQKVLEKKFDHYSARKAISDFHQTRGETKKAIEILQPLVEIYPYRRKLYKKMAEIYESHDHFDKAAQTIKRALKINPEDDGTWAQLAQYEMRLKKRKEALYHLEMGLKVNPNNVKIRKYLEFLKGEEKSFEDDFKVHGKKIVSQAKKGNFSDESPIHILLDRSIIRVYPDGTTSEFTHFMARITNEEGTREYDSYPISYYGGEQKVKIKEARVYRQNGTVVEARTKAYSWGSGGEFGGWRSHSIDLPTLQVGDIIEVQYRVDDLKQSFFGNYFGTTFYFRDTNPIDTSELILIAPQSLDLYFHSSGLSIKAQKKKRKDGTIVYHWKKENIKRVKSEPFMPAQREVYPKVQISTFKDWKEFGKWYWNLVRKQMETSQPLRQKVKELTKNSQSPFEKVRAVYNFVVTDIRYSSEWEFGVHGFKPYTAASIYSRKFGDCKDKAILINAMLKEVGIKSYPVLIRGEDRRSQEDLTLPLVGHFNHCISYVPPQKGIDKGIFLDGTAEFHSVDTLPDMDWGARVVVVNPDGGKIHQIPYPQGGENRYTGRYRIQLFPQGKGKMKANFRAKKSFAVFFRHHFQNQGRRKKKLERLWNQQFGQASVKKIKFSALKDLNEPVKGQYEIEIPHLLDKRGSRRVIPRLFEPLRRMKFGSRLTDLASLSQRQYDIVLTVPTSFDLTYEFEIPAGFKIENLPEEKKLDHSFGTFIYHLEKKGNILKIRKVFILKEHRIPVEKYKEFRNFCRKVEKSEEENIILSPAEKE